MSVRGFLGDAGRQDDQGPEEHHEHRYVGSEKQDPIVVKGPVNEAMHAVEAKLEAGWSEYHRSWESTR